jgi:type VI secretion system protein ImpB
MADSTQKKLERVRPPRIQISYEVETGGAIEMKELPFLMGVLGDFTGQPTEPLPKLKERKFVEVTPDNFDDVLASMKPHLAFTVENKLSEEPTRRSSPSTSTSAAWTTSRPTPSRAR